MLGNCPGDVLSQQIAQSRRVTFAIGGKEAVNQLKIEESYQ